MDWCLTEYGKLLSVTSVTMVRLEAAGVLRPRENKWCEDGGKMCSEKRYYLHCVIIHGANAIA
jgi:hypothetical protein